MGQQEASENQEIGTGDSVSPLLMDILTRKLIQRSPREAYHLPAEIFSFIKNERVEIQAEIVEMYSRWFASGVCQVNQRRFEYWAGGPGRKELTAILWRMEVAGVIMRVDPRDRGDIGKRAILRKFNEKFKKFDCANSNAFVLGLEWRCLFVDKSVWASRSDDWRTWCSAEGLPVKLDTNGSTAWGKASLNGLSVLRLPNPDAIDTEGFDDDQKRWFESAYGTNEDLFFNGACQTRNRTYHAMTGCPKAVRKLCNFEVDGEQIPLATVDIHACYWCALASMLPDGPEKDELIRHLQNRTFYLALADAVGAKNTGKFKIRVQTECIFWNFLGRRKVAEAMRRMFPLLHDKIVELRFRLGVGGLSDLLMLQELKVMQPTLIEASSYFPCFTIHDALACPVNEIESAEALIVKNGLAVFGFAPAIKSESRALAKATDMCV